MQGLEEEIQFLIAARGKPLQVAPGHEVCAQGDAAVCVWLLHEGVHTFLLGRKSCSLLYNSVIMSFAAVNWCWRCPQCCCCCCCCCRCYHCCCCCSCHRCAYCHVLKNRVVGGVLPPASTLSCPTLSCPTVLRYPVLPHLSPPPLLLWRAPPQSTLLSAAIPHPVLQTGLVSSPVIFMCPTTGELVATYHYREAESEKAPAIIGATALLAGSESEYRVRPCGYRLVIHQSRSVCWLVQHHGRATWLQLIQ